MSQIAAECIYCRRRPPEVSYAKREHVIPESFGKFQGNLVLHGKVCDSCNEFFANELELKLARDTYEGLERFDLGVKPDSEYKNLGTNSTMIIQLTEGPFKNAFAYQRYSPADGRRRLVPLEQVGLRKAKSEEFDFLRTDELPDPNSIDLDEYSLQNSESVVVFYPVSSELRSWMKSIGVRVSDPSQYYTQPYKHQSSDVGVTVTTAIDATVRRAVAKIAFNYVAYWNDTKQMLNPAFDEIRQYIRYGVAGKVPLVHVQENQILGDEPVSGNVRVGHIVVADWNDAKEAIYAKLSLFNNLTYAAILAHDVAPFDISVGFGHFFSIADMTIHDLGHGRPESEG